MVERTDRVTTGRKQQDAYYSDFLNDMNRHPSSGLMFRVLNEQSVKQSIRNLVLTNIGERLYQPTVGGNVSRVLFEPMDLFTADILKDAITQTLFNNEPRIESLTLKVIPNEAQNSYTVNIEFKTRNLSSTDSTEIILKRNR